MKTTMNTPESTLKSALIAPQVSPYAVLASVQVVVSLAVATLMAGCATTARGPELAVAPQYGEAIVVDEAREMRMRSSVSEASTGNVAHEALTQEAAIHNVLADPWWQAFGDPRLDALVDDVLARNRDLKTAALRLQRARLQAGLARNDRLPVAEGSATTSDREPIRDTSRDVSGNQSSASGQLSIGYELDLFGRLRSAEDAAGWGARASAEDLQSVALSLIANTCDLYWRLGDLNARIAQGDVAIGNAERTRALIQAQYRAGAVSGLETAEAEQSLQQRIQTQSRLRQQRDELRNALATLRDGLTWPDTEEPLSAEGHALPLDPGLPAELLGRRPDLRAAEARLRQTMANTETTRRSAYPRLNLTLGASGSGEGIGDLIDHPVRTLTRSVLLPFLDINGTRLRIAVARKDYEIAEEGFYQSLVAALSEIETALAAREPLRQQADSAQRTLAAAAAVEARYEVRYRAGAAPLRRWLDAQQSRIAAESSLSQAQLELRRNDIVLVKALGGSARMPEDRATSPASRDSGSLANPVAVGPAPADAALIGTHRSTEHSIR
jgi:NodT family efflux transporter outer membrane factor (OMF) lipoprotein